MKNNMSVDMQFYKILIRNTLKLRYKGYTVVII